MAQYSVATPPPNYYNVSPAFRGANTQHESSQRRHGWPQHATTTIPPLESSFSNRPLPPLPPPQKSPTYPLYPNLTASPGPSSSRRPTYLAGDYTATQPSTSPDKTRSPLSVDVRYTSTAQQSGSSSFLPRISPYQTQQASSSTIHVRDSGNTNGNNNHYGSPPRPAFAVDSRYLSSPISNPNLRGSTASYTTIPLEFSPNDLVATPATAPLQKEYSALDVEWDTIFDARKHRVPVLPETWFQDGWELAGVFSETILFTEKSAKKRRIMAYDIVRMAIRLVDVKYDVATLSDDGKYLLATFGDKLISILNVQGEKVIKKHKVKNLKVRKWCSNDKEFCWVDTEGKFWRWSFLPGEEPEMVFRLQANAPTYWLTPLTSPDGSWYAICATEKERRSGVVHCYPFDNGEARIFPGASAATFMDLPNGGRSNECAIALFTLNGNSIDLNIHGLGRNSQNQRHGRADVTVSPAMKLFPDIFIDPHSHLLVTVLTSATAEGSMALVFEPQTGAFAARRRLQTETGDRIFCAAHGVHIEKNASIFRRLKINPEGTPELDDMDAEEALFQSRSHNRARTHSVDTLPSVRTTSHLSSGSGSISASASASVSAASSAAAYRTMSNATTDMTSMHSRAAHNVKTKAGKIKHTWGRGTASTATDESWMLEKQREYRWMKEADD